MPPPKLVPIRKDRLQQILDERQLDYKPFATKLGLGETFFFDIFRSKGDRRRVQEEHFNIVVKGLGISPDVLIDYEANAPAARKRRRSAAPALPPGQVGLRVAGVCHSEVWRSLHTPVDFPGIIQAAPDLRFPKLDQVAYIVRPTDNHHTIVAITADAEQFTAQGHAIRDGTLVVVRREDGRFTETSLAMLGDSGTSYTVLRPAPLAHNVVAPTDTILKSDATVVAVALSVVRLNH